MGQIVDLGGGREEAEGEGFHHLVHRISTARGDRILKQIGGNLHDLCSISNLRLGTVALPSLTSFKD